MPSKEWEPANILDLFGDTLARQILVLASGDPHAADDLSDRLDASRPTIYRRLNALLEYDLLREHQAVDESGHHYKTYETTLQQITFEIEDGGYNIDIQLRRSLTDQFGSFWNDLEDASHRAIPSKSTTPKQSEDTNHG